jgi:putative aminopeptidase FrvX
MSAKSVLSVHHRVLHDMLSIPTAPFAEHKVIDYVERFCAKRKHLKLARDRAGNVLVRVRIGRRVVRRPVCITAHLDHPGFVADRMTGDGRLRAFWRGSVPRRYFMHSKVRFDVDGEWVHGVIRSVTPREKRRNRVDTAVVEVPRDVPTGAAGMWDFPDPIVRGTRIYARGCDDVAGASAMLCAIDELIRSGKSCDAYFLFTRAEEVGFVGAIAACRLKTIPAKCFVVAMETSSERPFAKMGDGPILRVGDKASTFTHAATAYCHRIARELARADKRFEYQRKLMDGGTCESSAYCTLGYEATGLCVALGNYHNVDAKRKKLAPEYIDLDDFDNVVKWFVELARAPRPYTGRDEALRTQITDLEQRYGKLLSHTA